MNPAIYYLSGLQPITTQLLYAYSLRRVVPTYTGPAIRVRNGSSAGAITFDVGFDANGNLDTAALLAGVSILNIGFVARWYDQSGNGKDANSGFQQPTGQPGREPIIVNVGKILVTKPGPNGTVLPATSWGFNYCGMQIASTSLDVNNSSIFIVCSNYTSTLTQRGISFGTNFTTGLTVFPRVVLGVSDVLMYNNADRITMGTTSTKNKIYSMLASPAGVRAWKNNEENPLGIVPVTSTVTTGTINIGRNFGTSTELFDGTIQEMLFYVGNLAADGTTSRSSVTAGAMAYYGINRLSSVTTADINYIEPTGTATGGGNVYGEFSSSVTAKGVCWSTSPSPTVNLATRTIDGQGAGSFTSNLNLLSAYTTYYARAYATNSAGTSYGEEKQFTTVAAPTGNFILDLYPSAHHAYSLRRLRTAYDGFCLRVRRETSTPTVTATIVDLAFDSNNAISLDSGISYVSGEPTVASTLGQFCAAPGYINTDGYNPCEIFVVTWFDQSGNVKNPTQAMAGNQPRLVNAGGLETSGGQVAVRFVKTSSNLLQLTDNTANIDNMSSYFVGAYTTNVANNTGYGLSGVGGTSRFYFPYQTSSIFAGYSSSPTAITLVTGTTTNRNLYELIAPSQTNPLVVEGWTNGISKGKVPLGSGATSIIQVGGAAANYYDGHIQEVIGWQSNAYRFEKEANIMDYYGIPRPPLLTTADINYIAPTGTAIGGGNLIDEFGITPTIKGVCWNILDYPEIDFGASTNDGTGEGAFTSNLSLLAAYTTYYVRAYGTNSTGTGYGPVKQFTTGNAPYVFILDAFPSAHHAFSLRKLRTAYGGFCLRVRRTTAAPNPVTTTTVDVAFDSNNTISFSSGIFNQTGTVTNAVNLGQFAQGTVDGFTASDINVITWYDQSGNNKNVTNASPGSQPRLVYVDGVTGLATPETKDGKVAVRFIRASVTRLSLIDTTMNINNLAQYIVTSLITTNLTTNSSTFRYQNNPWYLPVSNTLNTYIGYNSAFTHLSNANDTVNRLYSLVAGPTTYNAYRNTTNIGTGPSGSNSSQWIVLGYSGGSSSNALDGYIQESITWQNQSNVGQIQLNMITYYGI